MGTDVAIWEANANDIDIIKVLSSLLGWKLKNIHFVYE